MRLRSFIVIVLIIACALVVEGQTPDWFSLLDSAVKDWQLIVSEDDPLRLTIRQYRPVTSSEPYQILVLFPKRSSAYNTALAKIAEVFRNSYIDVELTAINFKGDDELGAFALLEVPNYDLLLTMGSVSTAYVYEHLEEIDIPVLSVTSKDPVLLGQVADYQQGSGTNMAFTSLNVPVTVQTSYMLDLKPELRAIGVLYAKDNISAYETQVLPLYAVMERNDIELIEVIVEDRDNVAEELAQKVTVAVDRMQEIDPTLQNSIFWITGSTSVFREIETINRHAGSVPVLSAVTDVVTEGANSAAMAIGVSFENNAHLAAIYAIDILTGLSQPGELKVGIVTPPDVSINFMKTRQIGLKIPFSFFELANVIYGADGKLARYRGEIIVRE